MEPRSYKHLESPHFQWLAWIAKRLPFRSYLLLLFHRQLTNRHVVIIIASASFLGTLLLRNRFLLAFLRVLTFHLRSNWRGEGPLLALDQRRCNAITESKRSKWIHRIGGGRTSSIGLYTDLSAYLLLSTWLKRIFSFNQCNLLALCWWCGLRFRRHWWLCRFQLIILGPIAIVVVAVVNRNANNTGSIAIAAGVGCHSRREDLPTILVNWNAINY